MSELVGKGWQFYEAQRSGKLPTDNQIPWRGDSYINDGSTHVPPLDLEGGWHDAGDTLKITFPLCATVCLHPLLCDAVPVMFYYSMSSHMYLEVVLTEDPGVCRFGGWRGT